jgi:hypothetical protein
MEVKKGMRCYEQFKNDRTCDMCEVVNNDIFTKCKSKYENKILLNQKLLKIESECPYKTECWDEYSPFTGCNKHGHGYGRFADYCKVTLECEMLKGE